MGRYDMFEGLPREEIVKILRKNESTKRKRNEENELFWKKVTAKKLNERKEKRLRDERVQEEVANYMRGKGMFHRSMKK